MAAVNSFDSPIKHAKDAVVRQFSSLSDETSDKGLLLAVESSSTAEFEGKHQSGLASASFGFGESQELNTDVVYTDSHLDFQVTRDFQEPESLEFKKLQLLRDLEAGSIFGGITDSVENAMMVDRNVIVGDVGKKKIEDRCYEVDGSATTSSLKIKLIDDTAVIEPCTGLTLEAGHQKKAKRPRRKGKCPKKAKMVCQYNYGGDGAKPTTYSREELLAMRFVGVVKQKRLWREIFDGLGSVAEEYASLVGAKNPKPRNPLAPGVLGEESCKEESTEQLRSMEDNEQKNVHFSNEGHSANGVEKEFEEDSDDSDEYYGSIQRPAFAVEGEPNFDAGPPEDGLEYLRRVRWEAARIPNVKVAKLEKDKLNKEQTAYMPVIPDIPKCPDHLMPTEEWEEAFLADFSRLRLALSQADAAKAEMSSDLQQQQQSIVVLGNPDFGVDDSHPDLLNEETMILKEEEEAVLAMMEGPSTFDILASFGVSNTLSLVLAMDSVSRVSKLKKRIGELEAMTELSREDCVWLFVLCAAVDTPFHADTCASVRSLLRKCASLRADKAEADEEVVMLNILATICATYFGQSDR